MKAGIEPAAEHRSLVDLFWSLDRDREERSLSPFQRVLLVTDGTVTTVLEAFVGEAIAVDKLSQSFGTRGPTDPQLDLDRDERFLERTVLLRGMRTGTTFIHAQTVIACDRLPPSLVEALMTTERPLGKLLAQHRMETFREIVAVGFVPARECAAYFHVDPGSELVFRTYRVHLQQRPLMRITERFPVSTFAGALGD